MIYEYDASKDKCPLPLVKMRMMLKSLKPDDVVVIRIADKGSKSDIPHYLTQYGYQFTQLLINKSIIEFRINTGK